MVTRSRERRPTEWFTTDKIFTTVTDGSQDTTTLLSAGQIGARFIKGTTITRMVIDFVMKPGSVAQDVFMYYGIVVMNGDAVVAGGFPEADDVSDRAGWMIRGRLITKADSVSDGAQFARRNLDIRSQRILRSEEDELQLIVDNKSAGGFTLTYSAYIRVLVKWA